MITFFSRVEMLLPCKYKEKVANIKEIKRHSTNKANTY